MKQNLICAVIWLACYLIGCFQWYWQGRRDEQRRTKKIFDKFAAEVQDIFDRHEVPPRDRSQPEYINRQ